VKENGFEDVIEVITARMEDVTAKDIPEPVDCVVSEWMGYALFFESMLPSVVHARDTFMRPEGLVLPNVADVRVALLEDQNRYDDGVSFWDDVYGFDFSSLASQTKRDWSSDPPVATVDPNCIVSDKEGALVVRVDCASVPLGDLYEPMAGTVELVAEKDCVAHGLCLWFDVDFYGRAFLSTSPSSTKTHWYQTVLMFEAPHAMRGRRSGGQCRARTGERPGGEAAAQRLRQLRRGDGGKRERESARRRRDPPGRPRALRAVDRAVRYFRFFLSCIRMRIGVGLARAAETTRFSKKREQKNKKKTHERFPLAAADTTASSAWPFHS
jgi:hypothetical protein